MNESEKKRILQLHIDATKKQYLHEQTIYPKGGATMKASQDYWDLIKELEGDPNNRANGVKEPVLKAYKDVGGVLTIGYGHTGMSSHPKVRPGMTITKQQALQYLYTDSRIAADCVRRMFKEWDDKGIDYRTSQNQFDALVSIAFNAGCESLRTAPFIQKIKQGDWKTAGKMIRYFKISLAGKNRRIAESNLFLGIKK